MATTLVPVFKRFDLVSDYSDHKFVKHGPFKVSNSCLKTIMKEWQILKKNLPDSIFVRVYEDRIDLMRAVIVGAAGTPYHDGLFVFDIHFPPNYPQKPPEFHYWSFGTRINPNLYENGTVCLSLLNTWIGRRSEKWNPKESTMLQILLSIQALVLNEKPYYNEPLVPELFDWRNTGSQRYNDQVFIDSCKTMVWLMQKPPKGFEALVVAHFRDKARAVLTACGDYANGRVRVGFHGGVGSNKATPAGTYVVSDTFVSSIKHVYRPLVVWFRKHGAHVGDLTKLKVTKKKAGKGIVSKIFDILKKILGFD